jgi:hypothetical protein
MDVAKVCNERLQGKCTEHPINIKGFFFIHPKNHYLYIVPVHMFQLMTSKQIQKYFERITISLFSYHDRKVIVISDFELIMHHRYGNERKANGNM